jgi:hypothetical protein
MAQRINVQLVDDIDGTDAVETVSFSLDGQQYEIDLSEDNAAKLRDALALFVANGRRTTSSRRGRGSAGRSQAGSSSGPSAADVRAWARENGFDVPDRGRVSAEVRQAYDAAH